MDKGAILNAIGIFFLVIGVSKLATAFNQQSIQIMLWFCYLAMFIIGFSILFKNPYFLASQINILAIPLALWTIDFVYFLINQQSLFGIVNYFFEPLSGLDRVLSLQHLVTIPLSLYALHLLKLKRKDAWIISIPYAIFIYLITKFLVSQNNNINCVYRTCLNFEIPIPYVYQWFVGMVIMVFATNLVLNHFFHKGQKSKLK